MKQGILTLKEGAPYRNESNAAKRTSLSCSSSIAVSSASSQLLAMMKVQRGALQMIGYQGNENN